MSATESELNNILAPSPLMHAPEHVKDGEGDTKPFRRFACPIGRRTNPRAMCSNASAGTPKAASPASGGPPSARWAPANRASAPLAARCRKHARLPDEVLRHLAAARNGERGSRAGQRTRMLHDGAPDDVASAATRKARLATHLDRPGAITFLDTLANGLLCVCMLWVRACVSSEAQ